MKENTVILNLDKYNKLKDLEKQIKKNKVHVYYNSGLVFGSYTFSGGYTFYTQDESIKKIAEINDDLVKTNKGLKTQINELKNPKPEELDFENMSILQFIKYKLRNK